MMPAGKKDNTEEKAETFEEFTEYSVLSGHCGWVWDCDFTMDNNYLITVCSDAKARIWKMGKEEIRKQLIGHMKGITCLAFCDSKKS